MALAVAALTRIAAFHHWPEAPEARAYLASPHRHLFHVRVTVAVESEGRVVEFHDLGELLTRSLEELSEPYPHDDTLRDFGPMSCEGIATCVADALVSQGFDVLAVSCSEDAEYTATWTKDTAP